MTTVGIDLISFYTPQYFLDLKTLAEKRGVDFNKFYTGLGQEKMAIPPPDEDIVTMAASAARPILDQTDPSEIELLLFGTESGVDQSKAAAMFVHGLLKLPTRCRGFEVKEACYAGTAALQLAIPWALRNPGKKALILASDIARYDLNSPGEPTQGAGAIAMLVGVNPRIMAIEPESDPSTATRPWWTANIRCGFTLPLWRRRGVSIMPFPGADWQIWPASAITSPSPKWRRKRMSDLPRPREWPTSPPRIWNTRWANRCITTGSPETPMPRPSTKGSALCSTTVRKILQANELRCSATGRAAWASSSAAFYKRTTGNISTPPRTRIYWTIGPS